MNGPVHEMILVALAAQGAIGGDASFMQRLWPDHVTFQYTQHVHFAEPAPGDRELILAEDPPAWAAWLKDRGVGSIALSHGVQTDAHMDRMTSGFVGGGRRWRIHTSDGRRHDSWEPRLALDHAARDEMIREQRRGGKIWRSSYLRHDESRHGPFHADVDAAAAALAAALEDVIAFAGGNGLAGWVDECFAPALRRLDGVVDPHPIRSSLSFAGFCRTPAIARLLDACIAAWVFGGMGSWNDQGFGEAAAKQDYERVSGALFTAVHRAVEAGVNGNGGIDVRLNPRGRHPRPRGSSGRIR